MKSITRLSKPSVKYVTTLGLGLLALGMIAAGPALAATATTNMAVTSSVTASCVILAAPLVFGPYNPTAVGGDVDAEAVLTFTCTLGATGIQITLGQGANPNAGSTTALPLRRMANVGATSFLNYFLYQDSAHTTIWGDTLGTAPPAVAGTGLVQTVTVFGQIPENQVTVPQGIYTDTVLVTITF